MRCLGLLKRLTRNVPFKIFKKEISTSKTRKTESNLAAVACVDFHEKFKRKNDGWLSSILRYQNVEEKGEQYKVNKVEGKRGSAKKVRPVTKLKNIVGEKRIETIASKKSSDVCY